MKQFPDAPQILVQNDDGTVTYQPVGFRQPLPTLSTWRQIGDFIDFRNRSQALAAGVQSTFTPLQWHQA